MPPRKPRLKAIRRLGTPLPGLTRKDAGRKPYPPGQHGRSAARRRKSEYRRQLEEKQKIRLHYGVGESQLRRYLTTALGQSGVTGETLLALLERRLDNVVFRLGFAPTIPSARQLVSHGHVQVNGRRLDRASYLVEPGDTISLASRVRELPVVVDSVARGPEVKLPGFLALDPSEPFTGRVLGTPARSDVPFIVEDAAVVEFYAR